MRLSANSNTPFPIRGKTAFNFSMFRGRPMTGRKQSARKDVAEPLKKTSTDRVDAGPAKLFLSYSRKDLEFVGRLSKALLARDQEVWVDLEGIQPSEDWLNAIHAAIEGADAFIF